MNEEFDDRLKSRIADVFDNFEDDSAHEGWLLLREKYPEKKKRPLLWLWWASAAAVLLMVLGLGLWLNQGAGTKNNNSAVVKAATKNTVSGNPDHDTISTSSPNNNNVANNVNKTNTVKSVDHTAQQTTVNKPNIDTSDKNSKAKITSGYYIAKNNKTIHREKLNKTSVEVDKQQSTSGSKTDAQQFKATEQQMANHITGNNFNNPVSHTADSAARLAANPVDATTKPTPPQTIKPVVKEPKHPLFTALNPVEPKTQKPVDKAVKFGVYAATYFNYAKGSDNEFNVGAGFSSEIRLAGNLKLVTGVAINQNSLQYTSAMPAAANSYLALSIANPATPRGFTASADHLTGVSYAQVASSPNLQNYQASLIGLDIPLNLKYQFSQSDTYVSAGVSSGTYVSETYTFVYNYSSAVANTQNQNTKTQNAFNTFDFARTLNLSFGMGYPVGKSNRLIVEPFVKYPLNGLGSQDIKFGAGGLNLKFNFAPGKK
jgi:hypothetical protein